MDYQGRFPRWKSLNFLCVGVYRGIFARSVAVFSSIPLSGVIFFFFILFLSSLSKFHALERDLPIRKKHKEYFADVFFQGSPFKKKSISSSREDLFIHVFGGEKKEEEKKTFFSFFLEDIPIGMLSVFISEKDADIEFESIQFMKKIKEKLKASHYENLERKASGENRLKIEDLKSFGLKVFLDKLKMECKVHIPAEYKKVISHNLKGEMEEVKKENITFPMDTSGYLNIHAEKNFAHSVQEGKDLGQLPLVFSIMGTLNHRNWVLEVLANYSENRRPAIVRDDIKLVRHSPEEMLAYSFGDLDHPSLGFQSPKEMLGIEFTKNFDLQPYKVSQPISMRKIFLKNPSTVEIWVNDVLEKSMELEPGEHDLRQFPTDIGSNNIEVRIEDKYGRNETVKFPFISEPSLLEEDVSSFSYSLGFPKISSSQKIRYDVDLLTFSFFHRMGWSKELTAGSYLQADPKQLLMGFEGLRAFPYGLIFWDLGKSIIFEGEEGIAFRTGFRNYLDNRKNKKKQVHWTVQGEYRTPHFGNFSSLDPYNQVIWDLGGLFSFPLFGDVYASLGGNYQLTRGEGFYDSYLLSCSLNKHWKNGLDFRFSLHQRRGVDGVCDVSAVFSLSWAFPEISQSIHFNHTDDDAFDVSWMRYPKGRRGWNASANYKRNLDSEEYLIHSGLKGNRGRVRMNYLENSFRDPSYKKTRTTKVFLDTAFAYVDGNFSISQPIANSFAMIIPKKQAKGLKIGVNPSGKDYQAEADSWGNAVIHNLIPYRLSKILLEAPNLPPGRDLGKTRYILKPSYKSGFAIYAGSEATILLDGVLLDKKGEAVSLQIGTIQEESGQEQKKQMFFTNREGKFKIAGLKPGVFRLKLMVDPSKEVRIEIPEGKSGVYKLGELSFPLD